MPLIDNPAEIVLADLHLRLMILSFVCAGEDPGKINVDDARSCGQVNFAWRKDVSRIAGSQALYIIKVLPCGGVKDRTNRQKNRLTTLDFGTWPAGRWNDIYFPYGIWIQNAGPMEFNTFREISDINKGSLVEIRITEPRVNSAERIPDIGGGPFPALRKLTVVQDSESTETSTNTAWKRSFEDFVMRTMELSQYLTGFVTLTSGNWMRCSTLRFPSSLRTLESLYDAPNCFGYDQPRLENLVHLTLYNGTFLTIDDSNIFSILALCSATLKYFKLVTRTWNDNEYFRVRLDLIPPMPRLEVIHFVFPELQWDNSGQILDINSRCPRLRKLMWCTSNGGYSNFSDGVTPLNAVASRSIRKLAVSIQDTRDWRAISGEKFMRLPTVFTNLTSLSLEVRAENADILTAIFEGLRNLQELSFKILEYPNDGVGSTHDCEYDALVIGCSVKLARQMRENDHKREEFYQEMWNKEAHHAGSHRHSIRGMMNLQKLKIEGVLRDRQKSFFGNLEQEMRGLLSILAFQLGINHARKLRKIILGGSFRVSEDLARNWCALGDKRTLQNIH